MNRCDLETALARATTTGTMLKEHELCWLYGLAAMAPDGPAVELGVYKGGSLSVWCGARRDDLVYGVDTWQPPKWDGAEPEYWAQLERHELDVMTLKVDSWLAADLVSGEIAFCFIDSTHNHTGFPKDFAAWMPRIMPGGVLVCHDYGSWKADIVVQQVLDDWHKTSGWWSLGVVGSAAAYMRPRGGIGGTR